MVTYKLSENVKDLDFWRAACCELVATAILVFIGCGSIVLHLPGNVITTSADIVRVALAFGLTVTVLIRTFGPISGCHVNPAVSLALLSVGRISVIRALVYSASQIIGGIAGTAILFGIVPEEKQRSLGLTFLAQGINHWQGLGIEIMLSFILLLVISACTDESRRDHENNKSTNPLVIGFTVAVLHLMAIPYTGSSLNPARTFGPALIDNFWYNQWIYWAGPIVGGCIGAVTYRTLLRQEVRRASTHQQNVFSLSSAPNRCEGGASSSSSSSSNSETSMSIGQARRQYQRYGMISVEPTSAYMGDRSASSQSLNSTVITLNSSQVPLFMTKS